MRMGMNGIFAAGDGVLLRVSRPTAPAQHAIRLAGVLTLPGLRVPTYLRDEPFVSDEHAVFAVGASRRQRAGRLGGGGRDGRACCTASIRDDLAFGYPVPFCGDFPWWDFASLMGEVGEDLDTPARAAINAAIGRGMPLLDSQRESQFADLPRRRASRATSCSRPTDRCCSIGTCCAAVRRRGTTPR